MWRFQPVLTLELLETLKSKVNLRAPNLGRPRGNNKLHTVPCRKSS